jgi:DMSO reductase anchor subunit
MAKVYQLRTMPAWNTWRTMTGFFIMAILLGQLLMMNVLQITGLLTWGIVTAVLAAESRLILSAKPKAQGLLNKLRMGLIAGAMVVAGIMSVVPNPLGMWTSLPILLMVLVEEIIGRWLFYEALQERAI